METTYYKTHRALYIGRIEGGGGRKKEDGREGEGRRWEEEVGREKEMSKGSWNRNR